MPRGIPKWKSEKKKEPTDFQPPYSEAVEPKPEKSKEPEKPAPKQTPGFSWQNNESQTIPKHNPHCRRCGHGPEHHYGSEHDWCNEQRCRCHGWQN